MKLVQFWKNDSICLGIQTEKGIVDVAAEASRRGMPAPGTMLEAIQTGLDVLRQIAEDAQCFVEAPAAPVVTGCDKILCIGLNYRQHAKECNLPLPAAPVLFNKFSNALAADGDRVRLTRLRLHVSLQKQLMRRAQER